METFGGNFKQTVIPSLNNFFCVFSVSYTHFCVVLNYKVLANFSSGYPLTITRDFPVHNTFCWVFPIRDASLTCPGVTVLFKKIRVNLKNFAIQLGDQGGRGEECLCVCVYVCSCQCLEVAQPQYPS